MGSGSLTRRKLPTMGTDTQGDLLWEPSEERIESATLTRYMSWLKDERGLEFNGYAALWEWSTDDLEAFWASLWEFFGVQSEDGILMDVKRPAVISGQIVDVGRVGHDQHVDAGSRHSRLDPRNAGQELEAVEYGHRIRKSRAGRRGSA